MLLIQRRLKRLWQVKNTLHLMVKNIPKMSKADAEKLLDDVNEMEHPDHEEADAEEIADAIKWRITASPNYIR